VVAEVIEISPIDFCCVVDGVVRVILEAMHGLYDDASLGILEGAARALIQGLDSYSKRPPCLLRSVSATGRKSPNGSLLWLTAKQHSR
jgi:hypothetical protein